MGFRAPTLPPVMPILRLNFGPPPAHRLMLREISSEIDVIKWIITDAVPRTTHVARH